MIVSKISGDKSNIDKGWLQTFILSYLIKKNDDILIYFVNFIYIQTRIEAMSKNTITQEQEQEQPPIFLCVEKDADKAKEEDYCRSATTLH